MSAKGEGIPRAPSSLSPRTVTQVMLYGMVESMTYRLRAGDAFDADARSTVEGFLRRVDAMREAYRARVGDDEVIDDEPEDSPEV